MVADGNYVPMHNFEKIMKFELVNNFVNYDYDGEFKETYSNIDGFPTLGYGQVKVDLIACTPEIWTQNLYEFAEKGIEEVVMKLVKAGTIYCIKEP
jgi:hypothetical protein